MQSKNRSLALAVAGILSVAAGSAMAAVPPLTGSVPGGIAGSTLDAVQTPARGAIPPGVIPNYRAIAAQNRASVVGITASRAMTASLSESADDQNPAAGPRSGPMGTLGSGFIVSADGLILTNAHVIEGAKHVTVTLSDHREFDAKVLGTDKTSDIAVLKIDAHGLPPVRIGNSDQLSVGDYVLAIGEPFGLEETATAGIVSAKGRSLPGDGFVPFIQIDAAVNPGNSGGPLFDATGAVVGINSQIYSNTGGYQGVAFAIPINVVERVQEQIVKTGRFEHGKLGVEVQSLTQALAHSFDLNSVPSGALVSKIEPDSAAARAGLLAGDVILKYDGADIADAGQLAARVSMTAPGTPATLDVWRAGKPLTVAALIEPANPRAMDKTGAADQTHLGLALRPLTPDERSQAGVTAGLVVQEARGNAAEAGIQPGDLVLSVGGTPVQSVAQLRELVHHQDKDIALLIQRGESRLFVPVSKG